MGLCAVSDLAVAESGTRFGFTETRLGILPAVIAPFVIAKIGESHARALFPSGRRFDAVRAQRIGLIHEVVEGEAALDEAVEQAVDDVLAAGPTAVRAAKAIVREVRGVGHGSAKWHTARVIARQRNSEEAQEGFRAFSEKRSPAWRPENEPPTRNRRRPARRKDSAASSIMALRRLLRRPAAAARVDLPACERHGLEDLLVTEGGFHVRLLRGWLRGLAARGIAIVLGH
jgi:hypothetical protein